MYLNGNNVVIVCQIARGSADAEMIVARQVDAAHDKALCPARVVCV